MRLIVILEHYLSSGEASQANAYDYDTLPENVKKKVDKCIEKGGSCYLNIYKNGIQYLYSIKHPIVKLTNDVSEFMGVVEFYSKN